MLGRVTNFIKTNKDFKKFFVNYVETFPIVLILSQSEMKQHHSHANRSKPRGFLTWEVAVT